MFVLGSMKSFLAVGFLLHVLVSGVCGLTVRVVTWNVADNKKMDDGFTDAAIDKVLGLKEAGLADVYAIGLQEQCWECNEGNFPKIGNKFLNRIKKKEKGYEVVHIEGTRESGWCEWGCKIGTHGTTLLVLIARNGLVTKIKDFHRNDDCSDSTPENDEKGVAAIKATLANGKNACFGSAHLESKKASTRRECIQKFFKDADEKAAWSSTCHYQFLFGDFNTRTGDKIKGVSDNGVYLAKDDAVKLAALKTKDELTGGSPYGTDAGWNKNMLAYVNSVQTGKFKEQNVTFMPTYSIRDPAECGGRKTCYRGSRPVSWTDRIIYTRAKVVKYNCITELYGDHFPVYGVYELN